MNRTVLVLCTALGVGVALAQATRTLQLTLNGRASSVPAIVVNGRTYVPLDALRSAGATSSVSGTRLSVTLPGAPSGAPAGGSDQRAALEGCVNEVLFNGVWRFRVTRVENVTGPDGQKGYALGVEFRNGTTSARDLAGTGAGGAGYELDNFQLALKDGGTSGPVGSVLDLQAIATKAVPQGAPNAFRLTYFPPPGADGAVAAPDKLVVAVERPPGVPYTAANPSFRVRLDCTR
ncbi:hypothetical protein [Deinococcus pimensis]|uniref:hypothetical protein n=1 Tax=Deinococcus pimensis TaxID=309888 RepID=UPI0004B99FF2|nr:hypothetical protein [Deinococcus pimensis]